MKTLSELDWIVSAVGAILLSVVANLLTPTVKNRAARWSSKRASRRIVELQKELSTTEQLRTDPNLLIAFVGKRLFDFLTDSVLAALCALCVLLPNSGRGMPSLLKFAVAAMGLLAVVFFSSAFWRGMNALRVLRRVQSLEEYRDSVEHRIERIRSIDRHR
jgi:hypothetical protein